MVEIDIVKKAIAGNDEAFLEFIKSHKEALYRTALAFLKNEDDALEAIQEVTFRAYRNIRNLRNPSFAKTWLIKIMMNYCRDVSRQQKRFVSDEQPLMLQGVSDNTTYLEIEEAFQTLTDDEKELIYLRYLHEIKIKDIAAMSATPESTIKTRLYKALNTLRLFLNEKEGTPRYVSR